MRINTPTAVVLVLAVTTMAGGASADSHDHKSWIAAESSCTNYEQLLRVHYDVTGEGASADDWVALLPSEVGSNPHDIKTYIGRSQTEDEYMWMTTTGDHETFEKIPQSNGNIAFQLHDVDEDDDDVSGSDSGDQDEDHTQFFRLHLIRGRNTGPSEYMHIIASSAPIKVARECPVACQSWIEVADTIVTAGEDVGLRIDNCKPKHDDFVALVPAKDVESSDSIDPHSPEVWVWACGDRDCREAVETNGVSISTFIPPGKYVAVLAEDDGKLKAVSQDEIRIDQAANADGTPCFDSVKVTSTCMSADDDFTLEISTCLPPRDGDWVGIFHQHTDPALGQTSSSTMLAFVYACEELTDDEIEANDGSPFTCTKTVSKHKNAIDETPVYKSHGVAWPLIPGEYQATLIHERTGISLSATAPSLRNSFSMKDDADNCSESTTRRRRFLRRNN